MFHDDDDMPLLEMCANKPGGPGFTDGKCVCTRCQAHALATQHEPVGEQ